MIRSNARVLFLFPLALVALTALFLGGCGGSVRNVPDFPFGFGGIADNEISLRRIAGHGYRLPLRDVGVGCFIDVGRYLGALIAQIDAPAHIGRGIGDKHRQQDRNGHGVYDRAEDLRPRVGARHHD